MTVGVGRSGHHFRLWRDTMREHIVQYDLKCNTTAAKFDQVSRKKKWDTQEPVGITDFKSTLALTSRLLTRGHRRLNKKERQAVAGLCKEDAMTSGHFAAILQDKLLRQLHMADKHPAERHSMESDPFLPSVQTLQATFMVFSRIFLCLLRNFSLFCLTLKNT